MFHPSMCLDLQCQLQNKFQVKLDVIGKSQVS